MPRSYAVAGTSSDPGVQDWTCGPWWGQSIYYDNISERFVRSVGTLQGKPFVVQTVDSSHSMGVAFSYNGWSQSGTQTKTTGASINNHQGMNVYVHNRVRWLFAFCRMV
jgi:hypothetical protein